jgi:hypothetical protein
MPFSERGTRFSLLGRHSVPVGRVLGDRKGTGAAGADRSDDAASPRRRRRFLDFPADRIYILRKTCGTREGSRMSALGKKPVAHGQNDES